MILSFIKRHKKKLYFIPIFILLLVVGAYWMDSTIDPIARKALNSDQKHHLEEVCGGQFTLETNLSTPIQSKTKGYKSTMSKSYWLNCDSGKKFIVGATISNDFEDKWQLVKVMIAHASLLVPGYEKPPGAKDEDLMKWIEVVPPKQ